MARVAEGETRTTTAGRLSPVLVATRNAGKLIELRPMLREAGYEPVDLVSAGIEEEDAEAGVECHSTFEENALAKARYFAARAGGLPVLADDSGLAVDALHGAPGVHSRRWAMLGGDTEGALTDETAANNARLLRELSGVTDRSARFVCAAAWVDGPAGTEQGEGGGGGGRKGGVLELVRRGEVEGTVLEERRGEGGFGYDPYFYSTELGRGFGEASREEKASVSHRARAVAALLGAVAGLPGRP